MDYDSCTSLPAMFFTNTADIGDRPFLWAKRQGTWAAITGAQARAETAALTQALSGLGVGKGDRVALISESRPEWMIADIAVMAAGGISVPAYTTNQVSDHVHVLRDSGAKGAIVSGPTLAENLLPAAAEVGLDFIISMEPLKEAPQGTQLYDWAGLISQNEGGEPDLSRIVRTDTSCLIYTSGTGGVPKGVMLSHGAIISNCKGAYHVLMTLGLDDEVFLSFLPLSHSYEHTAGLMFPISIKAQVYYAEGVDKLAANMEETRPTIMTAVPRLYETMHGRIIRGVQQKGGLSEKLFMKAVETGRKRYEGEPLGVGDALLDQCRTEIGQLRQQLGADAIRELPEAEPVTIEGDAILTPLGGETGDASRGKAVFTDREQGHCVLCHAVAGLEAEFQGNVGPPLTGLGDRLSPGQIRLRIADAQRIWPQTVMPSYYRTGGLNQVGEAYRGEPALSARQIEDLVAWLSTLKTQDGEE